MSNDSQNKKSRAEKLIEISFYRKNTAAYNAVLLAIIAEFVYVVTVLGQMEVTYKMGVVTMANIAILFLLFTIAIKVNVYDKRFTFIGFGMVAYLALRVLLILPHFIEPLDQLQTIYISSVVTLVCLLIGCVISLKQITARSRYKEGAV